MAIQPVKPTIYKRVANYIQNHKRAQKFLQNVESNTGLYSGILAFGVGTTLKPVTIMSTPGNKEDKKYATAKSISTAIADVGLAVLIFVPLKKILDSSAKKLYNIKNTVYYQNPDACSRFKSISNRVLKIVFIPAFAIAKYAFIDPIVKKMNKRSKSDK